MAGNHNAFRGNQFSSYIIPLVDHFNAPGTRFNPFEAWAAANVLTAFTQRWQGSQSKNQASYALNGSYVDRTTDGDTKLVDSFASKIEYAANRERTVARTNLVQQLEKKLKSAFVGGSNAWVDWLHATEYYFDNVDFADYFTYNYNAEYRQLLFDSLAMFKHPELTLDGYDFIIKTQGEFPTKAVTTIDVGTLLTGLDLPFPAPYIATYRNATTLDVFWINENNYVQPVVDGGVGVTSNYHPLNGIAGDATANTVIFENTINALAVGYTVNNLGTQLTVEPPVTGSLPATLFNFDSYALAAWNVAYVDGTGTVATDEAFYIDFRNAKATEIAGKYSVINDQVTGDNHIIWWNTGGIPQPTVSVANPVYTELVIDSADSPADISQVLELAIGGGAPALSFMNVITPGEILELEFVADVTFETDTLMPGTAATGIDFAFSDKLYASDNTELASGITTLAEYATLYNSLLVPYELSTFNTRYPYIIGFGGGGATESDGTTACGVCQQTQGWIPIEAGDIIEGCNKCYNFAGGGGPKGAGATAFRSGPYEGSSYTSPLTYNTPQTIFDVVEGAKTQYSVKEVDQNL